MVVNNHISFREVRRKYPDEYIGLKDIIEKPDKKGILTKYGIFVCKGDSEENVWFQFKNLVKPEDLKKGNAILMGINLLNIERIGLSIIEK